MVNENLGNAIAITPVGFLRKVEGGKALVRLQFRPDLTSVFLPSFSSRIFPFFFITSDRPFLSERPVLKIGPYNDLRKRSEAFYSEKSELLVGPFDASVLERCDETWPFFFQNLGKRTPIY